MNELKKPQYTYTIKDLSLEVILEKEVPNFHERFKEECEHAFEYENVKCVSISWWRRLAKGVDERCQVDIQKDRIKRSLPYNPDKWNVFPETTPPAGYVMRVDFSNGGGGKLVFNNDKGWVSLQGKPMPGHVVRFRPWDESNPFAIIGETF